MMSPKKDVNKVTKTPSKRKATPSPTSSGPSSPQNHVYEPVSDLDFVWAVLYQATDTPKPNYQRAADLLGMPYQTVFGRFARMKKVRDGTPVASPTPKQHKTRKAGKSEGVLKSEVGIPTIKEEDGIKSDIKAEIMLKVEVDAKEAAVDDNEA